VDVDSLMAKLMAMVVDISNDLSYRLATKQRDWKADFDCVYPYTPAQQKRWVPFSHVHPRDLGLWLGLAPRIVAASLFHLKASELQTLC
jgi:hypothetical protein